MFALIREVAVDLPALLITSPLEKPMISISASSGQGFSLGQAAKWVCLASLILVLTNGKLRAEILPTLLQCVSGKVLQTGIEI